MARHHNAIGRQIRGQAPGVFALAGHYFTGMLGRPADARRFAHFGAQILSEVGIGVGARSAGEGLEYIGLGIGQGRVGLTRQLFVQALADDCPIAQVVGDAPDEADIAAAQCGYFAGRILQEGVGGVSGLTG